LFSFPLKHEKQEIKHLKYYFFIFEEFGSPFSTWVGDALIRTRIFHPPAATPKTRRCNVNHPNTVMTL
jgi:hypothetical protein